MLTEKIFLPKEVENIISQLEAAGFRADAVGGAVRDSLLGKSPFDYDITTSAAPDEMKTVFSSEKLIETGIKHGTLTLVLDGKPYEITTYRIDGEYSDSRHPESVSFTRNIEDDLSRRDFTVNAMAYSAKRGLTDLFSGIEDLERGIIRAVGEPRRRFEEDALRILRALRFASVLDFEIEEKTEEALISLREKLSAVSKERIYSEFMKLLGGVGAHRILSKYSAIISVAVPELKNYTLPDRERFDRANTLLRLAALFADKDSAAANAALANLRADNKTKNTVSAIIENRKKSLNDSREMKHALSRLSEETVSLTVDFREMLGISDGEEREILYAVLSSGECYKLAMLKINGEDICRLGIKGKAVGEVLEALLCAVIDGEVSNNRDSLAEYAVKLKK